ncbi:MAG TPA: hypothetical protein VNV85_07785 [Puia sp.]|jgi:hypothetical protein|nr:hypothetical protein [Puia sp.]
MKKKKKSKNPTDINLPKEDIKVEKGQHTLLPALKKIINIKKQSKN